jgi:hypothetical protein
VCVAPHARRGVRRRRRSRLGQYLNEFSPLRPGIRLSSPTCREYGGAASTDFDPSTWVGDLPANCAVGVFNIHPSSWCHVRAASAPCERERPRQHDHGSSPRNPGVLLRHRVLGLRPRQPHPFMPLGMAGVSPQRRRSSPTSTRRGVDRRWEGSPPRDLPRAILLSLVIVTICYLLVTWRRSARARGRSSRIGRRRGAREHRAEVTGPTGRRRSSLGAVVSISRWS